MYMSFTSLTLEAVLKCLELLGQSPPLLYWHLSLSKKNQNIWQLQVSVLQILPAIMVDVDIIDRMCLAVLQCCNLERIWSGRRIQEWKHLNSMHKKKTRYSILSTIVAKPHAQYQATTLSTAPTHPPPSRHR